MFLLALISIFLGLAFHLQTSLAEASTNHLMAADASGPQAGRYSVKGAASSTGKASSGHEPLDVDGYVVAPPELELQQVHVFMRHGERTPVGVRMADPPANIPEHWLFCNTAREFRAAVASSSDAIPGTPRILGQSESEGLREESLNTRRVVERADGTVVEGECLLGELTDIGRQSTYNYGRALRQLYIDRLAFLPDVGTSNGEAYFRSTNVPRTIESLQQVVHGLYPSNKSAEDFVPHIRIRNGNDENLYGNTNACKRLQVLLIGHAQAAAAAWNSNLEPLNSKLSKYINGNPVRLDGRPRASGILDTLNACKAHGIPYPPEFDEPRVFDTIEKAVVQEWFGGYRNEEIRRLGMGPLLSDMMQKMEHKLQNGSSDPLKILVHSTHDTCIAALSNTLDVYDEKWPPFSAALTFELFVREHPDVGATQMPQVSAGPSSWQRIFGLSQRPQAAAEHFVRVRYQNKDLRLPLCTAQGNHLPGRPEFCTLTAFKERVAELNSANWEQACAAPSFKTGP